MIKKFNDKFWFGAATSGPQTEGSKNKINRSIYDKWFDLEPDAFHDKIGPNITCNEYENYKSDVKLMKTVGLNSFRTSIQWSRLIKDFKNSVVDEDAVNFYRSYFSEIKNEGIELVVNLFHFDIPEYLFDKYKGWEGERTIELYIKYAEICFDLFGDIVDYWVTFNEPSADAEAKYLQAWHYPYIKDFDKYLLVSKNMMLGHAGAVEKFKNKYGENENKKIGIILNLTPVYTNNNLPKTIAAKKIAEFVYNNFYLDLAIKGKFDSDTLMFMKTNNIKLFDDDLSFKKFANGKVDFVGVNYYQPKRIQKSKNKSAPRPWCWFEDYVWPQRRVNPYRGWEIHPKTIYEIAMKIKEKYNNIPFFISENGIGVQNEISFSNDLNFVSDDYRIDFVKEHLYWLALAIENGANCFGYHIWTFVDCWSWANAYKNRYGLISLNLATQERTVKKSGIWFKNLSETKTLEIDKVYE